MNPVDALWLTADRPENLMVIEALLVLAGPLDRDRLEQVVQERVVDRFPVFGQRPSPAGRRAGRRRWVDDPGFRIGRHVREVELSTPDGDDAALQEYVARHLTTPLPDDRPLWEVHVLRGLRRGTALYVRLHHAIADGIALTQVLLSLTDTEPDAPAGGPAAPALAGRASDPGHRRAGTPPRRLPRRLAHGAVAALRVPSTLAKLLLLRCPPTALSGRASRTKRVVWARPVPLADVKEVARATGSTVNDVLVAALAGALHRYQQHHDGTAVDLPTMVPVNLRPLDEPLEAGLGNRFAVVLLRTPSGLPTPGARLAETKRRMDALKRSPEPALTFTLMHGIGRTGRLLGRALAHFFAAKAVGVTTNVPGPTGPRYLAGARIEGLLGWVPGTGHQSLGTCIFSYDGRVWVGFKADDAAVPDPERIAAAFEEEIGSLQRHARGTALA